MYKYFHDAVKNVERPNNHDEIYDFLLTHLYSLCQRQHVYNASEAHRTSSKQQKVNKSNMTKQVNTRSAILFRNANLIPLFLVKQVWIDLQLHKRWYTNNNNHTSAAIVLPNRLR